MNYKTTLQLSKELPIIPMVAPRNVISAATTSIVEPLLVVQPPERTALNWNDYVFRHDPASHTLRLYFLKTPKGIPLEQERLINGVSAFKDGKGIRYIEFDDSRLLPHMLDTPEVVDCKPPLELSHHYDPYADILEVSMVSREWKESVGRAGEFWNEQDNTQMLIFDVDGQKKIMGIIIMDASTLIAK